MKFDIGIMRLAGSLASYAAKRQSLIAQNIANADTPGYRARDMVNFSDLVQKKGVGASTMRATRPEHFGSGQNALQVSGEEISAFGIESPNGNNVALEDQLVRGAQVKQSHEMALGVYKTSIDILRLGIGRRN